MNIFKKFFSTIEPESSLEEFFLSERWKHVVTFVNLHIDEISKFQMSYSTSGAIVIDYDVTKQFVQPLYGFYQTAYFFEERPGERRLTGSERDMIEQRLLTILRSNGLSVYKSDLSHNDSTDNWYIVQRTSKYKEPY